MPDGARVLLAELWDWRRRTADSYAAVRSAPDPQRAWTEWRATREAMFRDHGQSPLDPGRRAGFSGLPFFAYDPALRFTPRIAVAQGESLRVGAGEDGLLELRPFARTIGLEAALGGELTLFWLSGYGGGAFLPFTDATSGRDSYGGGRYLLDTIKGADLGSGGNGLAVLDFNFAYNPSCSYSDRYICPLAPPCNRLPHEVRAGERVTAPHPPRAPANSPAPPAG